jgi:hypothetical protein
MSNWPSVVSYTERLALDASGSPTTIEVTLPSTRDDAFDLVATIDRLSREDPATWKSVVRQYTACDWFVLGLFLHGAQRLDPFTGRPEMDCDFLWNHYRQIQFEGQGKLNKSFRGSHKSHILLYVGVTNKVLLDPNRVMAIAAHEKSKAGAHGWRTALEWETNVELKAAWPDVFFEDPKRDPDCPLWNQETGVTVRRTIPAVRPTLSWYAIENVPTGSRIGDFFFDDVENESTVESDDQREKLLDRFLSFDKTAGRMPSVYINATSHHPNGLVAHLERSSIYEVIHHPAEDVDRPAPDIAKLYDECGGRITNRATGEVIELPPAVRDIRLDGAPTMHHPLELAMMRLKAEIKDDGIAEYYRHMMGDNLAGEDKRLKEEWIRYYEVDPVEMALGCYLYITVDASKGLGDPTFARVEACRPDKTIAWVGGLRKKIEPSDFGKEIWLLGCQWEGIGVIKEFRFEIFGQATWDTHFIQYCESRHHWPGNTSAVNVKSLGRNTTNRLREWNALQPLYKNGRRLFPRDGVMFVEDERGRRIDLPKYYREKEYLRFPLPITDDGLAADALLGEPEDHKKGIYALEFPESEEEVELRESLAWRRAKRDRGDEDGGASWMSEGL